MFTYADAGLLLLPFSQSFLPEPVVPPPPYDHFRLPPPPDDGLLRRFGADLGNGAHQMANLLCNSSVSEYDLGGEGDLFKAPEAIIEEPEVAIDPMTAAAMSIISSGDDVIAETINVAAMEPINEDPLMSDVFYECKKELLAKSATGEPISDLSDVKFPPLQAEGFRIDEKNMLVSGVIQRSISSGCLKSVDWANGCTMRPNFLDFQGLDVQAVLGMRRAFSEGDIQIIRNNNLNLGNKSIVCSPFEPLSTVNDIKAEERREKLSRYRKKKTKRDFGRKIKYACRKALADSQPRVRGRFAKTEDCEVLKLDQRGSIREEAGSQ